MKSAARGVLPRRCGSGRRAACWRPGRRCTAIDPVVARLDEQVVPQPGDVLLDDVDLAGDDRAAARAAARRRRRPARGRPPEAARRAGRVSAWPSSVAASLRRPGRGRASGPRPRQLGGQHAAPVRRVGARRAGPARAAAAAPASRPPSRSTFGRSRSAGRLGCSTSMSAETTPATSWMTRYMSLRCTASPSSTASKASAASSAARAAARTSVRDVAAVDLGSSR